jgi:transcriptional regulator with XRE-family HTH domain
MAGKPRPLIIKRDEFRIYLMATMGSRGFTVEEFAEKLGVTGTTVYALLSGDLAPSDEIIEKIGLESVYIIGENRPAWMEAQTEAAPAKPKAKK